MLQVTRRHVLAGAAGIGAAAALGARDRAAAAAPASAQQAPGYYRYRVGDIEVTVVTDGVRTVPLPDGLVTNVKKEEVSAALKAAHMPADTYTTPYTPIVVNTGGKLVLIDTGNGEGALAEKPATAGQLMANLAAAGIERDAIDIVVISHFHGDHVNGLVTASGAPAFPKAEIKVPETEWNYWMDDGEMSRAPKGRIEGVFKNNRRVFDALGRKVTRYPWDKEVASGVTAVATVGHTPGHTSFVIASGSGRVFVQSDVTHTPVLFAPHPGWHAFYDQDPVQAEATRRKTYDMVSAERMLIQGFHYPFPSLGHVDKAGDGYRVVPVPWTPVI